MRCGCPECGTYMIQSESLRLACVCPACLYRCSACMGTNTVIPKEALRELAFRPAEAEEPEEAEEAPEGPVRPEEWID